MPTQVTVQGPKHRGAVLAQVVDPSEPDKHHAPVVLGVGEERDFWLKGDQVVSVTEHLGGHDGSASTQAKMQTALKAEEAKPVLPPKAKSKRR